MFIINPKYSDLNITKYLINDPNRISTVWKTRHKYFKQEADEKIGTILKYSKNYKSNDSTISVIDGNCPNGYLPKQSGYEHLVSETSLLEFAVIFSTISVALSSIQISFIFAMQASHISHLTASVMTLNSIIGGLLFESTFRDVDKFYDWVTVCEEETMHAECLVGESY